MWLAIYNVYFMSARAYKMQISCMVNCVIYFYIYDATLTYHACMHDHTCMHSCRSASIVHVICIIYFCIWLIDPKLAVYSQLYNTSYMHTYIHCSQHKNRFSINCSQFQCTRRQESKCCVVHTLCSELTSRVYTPTTSDLVHVYECGGTSFGLWTWGGGEQLVNRY